jgi:uncharacterized protein YdeI (YjbR/CyaY-like superfamily)
MNKMTKDVELYFTDGCGRCSLGGTPQCKVRNWQEELTALRMVLRECELTEEVKWGVPCYTSQKKNIIILSAFKEYCSLSFFKGALLKDPQNILQKQGENSQLDRVIKFTTVKEIHILKPVIKAYIDEAIAVEQSGLKVETKKNPEPIPEELQELLDKNPEFKTAFETLTPGRQRGYILYFSQPKQSKTRVARIEKYTQQILDGVGMYDHYKSMKK